MHWPKPRQAGCLLNYNHKDIIANLSQNPSKIRIKKGVVIDRTMIAKRRHFIAQILPDRQIWKQIDLHALSDLTLNIEAPKRPLIENIRRPLRADVQSP